MLKSFLHTYKAPIVIFLTSRFLILLVVMLTTIFLGQNGVATINRWDSINYISIAENGYQFSGKYEHGGELIAFFPLFPILINLVAHIPFVDYFLAGIILSFIFGLGAAILLYKLVFDWKGHRAATVAVTLLSFYPGSIFLSAAYTESLFLFLTLFTFYLWENKNGKWSTLTVALSCVTRMTGSVLGLIFAWDVWSRTKNIPKTLLYCLIAGIPFFAFLLFQYLKYGTPLAFMDAQHVHWQQYGVIPIQGLWLAIERAIFDTNYPVMWKVDLVYLVTMVVTMIISFKVVPRRIWVFGLGVMLLTLSSNFILGMGRYLMLVLPFYFYWGFVLAERRTASKWVVFISTMFMLVTTVLFSLSRNVL